MEGEIREGTFYLNDTFAPSLKMVVKQFPGGGFYMRNESREGLGPDHPVREADWAALVEAPNPEREVW